MDDNFNVFQTMTTTPRTFPQMDLTDIQDRQVDVNSLASSHHLILITLKNVTCPVCPQLLKILNMYGLDPDINTFSDPFSQHEWEIDSVRKKFFRLLLKFDAYFIILCPGTNTDVGDIQRKTPFLDYPFIAGEQANTLAKALKIHISDDEFMPAILEVSKGTLAVDPIYIGRGPGNYFHNFLLKRLVEERCKLEMKGIICIRDINETINQLKRKIIKCQNGKMAGTSITASPLPWSSSSTKSSSSSSSLSARLLSTSPIKRSPPPRPSSFSSSENVSRSSEEVFPILKEEEPISPLPGYQSTKSPITATSTTRTSAVLTGTTSGVNNKQIKKQSLDGLPLEILEIILSSYCDDIPSLVKTSGTCRAFYIAVCNVLILCLRNRTTLLKPALPQQNGKVIWDEAEVVDQSLDRWSECQDGVPFRELQYRVTSAKELLSNTCKWTRHWSPRRLRTAAIMKDNNKMYE